MPMERIDGRAVSYLIGASPWDVQRTLESIEREYVSHFTRWDGATFDEAGMMLLGRLRYDDGGVPMFIVVNYDYSRGGWTEQLRGQLNDYLERLGLGYYMINMGYNRFMSSVYQ
jgi:hypothetical protein